MQAIVPFAPAPMVLMGNDANDRTLDVHGDVKYAGFGQVDGLA